jgi:hypothetical protein
MRNYTPRRPDMNMDTVAGPEERAKRAMMIRQAKEKAMDEGAQAAQAMPPSMKKGGKVAKYAKGGSIDGIAQRGKTRGKIC